MNLYKSKFNPKRVDKNFKIGQIIKVNKQELSFLALDRKVVEITKWSMNKKFKITKGDILFK